MVVVAVGVGVVVVVVVAVGVAFAVGVAVGVEVVVEVEGSMNHPNKRDLSAVKPGDLVYFPSDSSLREVDSVSPKKFKVGDLIVDKATGAIQGRRGLYARLPTAEDKRENRKLVLSEKISRVGYELDKQLKARPTWGPRVRPFTVEEVFDLRKMSADLQRLLDEYPDG